MRFEIIQKDKKGKLSGYEYKTLSGAVNTLLRMIYHPPFGEYEIFFKCKNKNGCSARGAFNCRFSGKKAAPQSPLRDHRAQSWHFRRARRRSA